MTGWQIALLVSAIVVFDLIVVTLLLKVAIGGWNAMAERFGEADPVEPSETRRFQSFRLGILNLGYSVHVTVDPERLHLRPVLPLRKLGMRRVSVPWEAITLKPRGMFKRYRTAGLGGGKELTGPAWCLELAERAERASG